MRTVVCPGFIPVDLETLGASLDAQSSSAYPVV